MECTSNFPKNLSLEKINNNSKILEKFIQICINAFDQIAPRKKKFIHGNNMHLFNRELVYIAHTKSERT